MLANFKLCFVPVVTIEVLLIIEVTLLIKNQTYLGL